MSYWRYNNETGEIEKIPYIQNEVTPAGIIDENSINGVDESEVEQARDWSQENEL